MSLCPSRADLMSATLYPSFVAGTRFFLGPGYDGQLDDSAPGENFTTKYGVTEMTYAQALVEGVVTTPWAEVQTVADVLPIYWVDYYGAQRCGEMPASVGMVVYVDSTLMGLHQPAIALQHALGVTQDGRIGNVTLAALARQNKQQVAALVEAADLKYLRRLPIWPLYQLGWTHREQNLLVEALKLELQI